MAAPVTHFLSPILPELMQEREEARRQRDFGRADEIRDLLASQGIVLEDTKAGTRWKRAG